MPTEDNLIVVSVCDLCLSHYETTHHLFLSCPFASQFWLWLGSLFSVTINCSSFSMVFQSVNVSWSAYPTNLALSSIIHVLHSIWMARNGIRFNNARMNIQAAKVKILISISISVNLATGFSEVSENVILQALKLSAQPRAPVVETMVL
ncbi:hypothetical protein QL285_034354 [Trifolium repens]|nr:hypothetical protein QL285_034354 [Trifolium repens]